MRTLGVAGACRKGQADRARNRETRLLDEVGLSVTGQRADALAHDPEKCVAVFPRDKRERVCAEITRKH